MDIYWKDLTDKVAEFELKSIIRTVGFLIQSYNQLIFNKLVFVCINLFMLAIGKKKKRKN